MLVEHSHFAVTETVESEQNVLKIEYILSSLTETGNGTEQIQQARNQSFLI